VARVTREGGVIAEKPQARHARGRGRQPFDIKATLSLHDHHAANWRCAAEAREAAGARWKYKEPVPREEGRLH